MVIEKNKGRHLGRRLILPNLEKNINMHYYKNIAAGFLVAVFGLFTSNASAQVNAMGGAQDGAPSDAEVEKFITITKEIQSATSGMEAKVNEMLEKHGLEMEAFQRMAQAQQMGGDLSSFSAEQQAAFKEMQPQLQTMQQGAMMSMNSILKKHDMDMMSYQQMARSIQQNPALQSKVQKAMSEGEGQEKAASESK